MKSLGPSLGARFAVSSAISSSSRKKKLPRNKTLTCATTKPVHDALSRLANKLNITNSAAIERAVLDLCAKHGVELKVGSADD